MSATAGLTAGTRVRLIAMRSARQSYIGEREVVHVGVREARLDDGRRFRLSDLTEQNGNRSRPSRHRIEIVG